MLPASRSLLIAGFKQRFIQVHLRDGPLALGKKMSAAGTGKLKFNQMVAAADPAVLGWAAVGARCAWGFNCASEPERQRTRARGPRAKLQREADDCQPLGTTKVEPMPDNFDLASHLAAHGQSHLVQGLDQLPTAAREPYLARLADIDWEELQHHSSPPSASAVGKSRVIDHAERSRRSAELERAGEAAYRAGQVAVLMVAGGQGTRLGSSAPKGCFSVAPHSAKSIYQLQAEKVLSLSRRIGKAVPFLVMTSPMTDSETRDFFAVNGNFGLTAEQVRFFSQGTVPSLDAEGRALLSGPGTLLENPDGHGGCFTALVKSGNLARLRREGVTQIVYIQVDNILVPVDDALLVGVAVVEQAEVVTKVLEKAHPDEKVGHLVKVDGHDVIVEYTEVTPEQARSRDAAGELIYRWGSPAMHCWSVAFLGRLTDAGYKIPLHRSSKPLKAWLEGKVQEVKGWKNERFIFDLIPEAKVSVGLAIDRDDEFAPVKNKEGIDSPATAVELAHRQFSRWLATAGVTLALPSAARIEISPLYAATQSQFLERWDRRVTSLSGDYYLEEDRASANAR
jgi:UDP-N-acetylglucosamine/UDP-N-acetylgalactosamine diphosphorylase